MSQNQEIIESKLCAYIDGDLDADGRTEIEKHLDANPQHRRLLESLKATRDLIKWLPREPAPPELAETLNGQLERSVLLDFDERSLNRNIGPRVLSAAAIILLTAGLGVAVYFTLPKSQKTATPYAMVHDSQSPMPDGMVAEAATEPSRPDDAMAAGAALAKITPPILSAKPEADRAADPELDRLAFGVSQNKQAIVAVANAAGPAGNLQQQASISPNAMVMLVQADSTEQATHDVTTYLQAQNIQYKPAAGEPAPSAADQLINKSSPIVRENMLQRDAARSQMSLTTRPDGSGNAQAAANQPQDAQSQLHQSLNTSQLAANVYVARMSRRQAIDLNNSVQSRARKSELKDLTGPSANSQSQSQNLQSPQTSASQAASQVAQQGGKNLSDQSPSALVQPGQGQLSQTAPAMAPAPAAARQMKSFAANAAPTPATQRAGALFGSAAFARDQNLGVGGGGSSGTTAATEPTTSPGATQPATTELADLAIDVVIVVQPDVPTTEPATAIPQTQPASILSGAGPQRMPATQPASH